MMVVFVSRSEKKALKTTRTILDSFAERIGDDTWKTIITMDGLERVQAVLRRNATKNMAVSCHWIRSRSHSELVWIVGNRSKFGEEGVIPISSTQKNLAHREWENNWHYLPYIKSLTAMAALLHDWGKASDYFQWKLRKVDTAGDPYRHEWISCKLIEAMVLKSGDTTSDTCWLELFAKAELGDNSLCEAIKEVSTTNKLAALPPIATALVGLILSHHRLPKFENSQKHNESECRSLQELLSKKVDATWGYENKATGISDEEWKKNYLKCFTFSEGLLLEENSKWRKELVKWSSKLLEQKKDIVDRLESGATGESRSILLYARTALMIADHYISSLPIATLGIDTSQFNGNLWANLYNGQRKQILEEHLLAVKGQALKIVHRLPSFYEDFERIYDLSSLKKKSPKAFAWQDQAVEKITNFKTESSSEHAYFVVNMASTGCGKTFANAKIMRALSKDNSLRYVLALGLRTLTLQTGDEYRARLSLSENDLAVLIGSTSIQKLHVDRNKYNLEEQEDVTSLYGSPQELLPESLKYIDTFNDGQYDFLNLFFNKELAGQAIKNKAFLTKPILVATIDHLMGATETKRGGRYMLPLLRMMSSDLVVDEIDDFTGKDLIAISRLVHLAGLMGKNVVLSSATMPPDLAEGFFAVYYKGLQCYQNFFKEIKKPISVICDEFKTQVRSVPSSNWREFFKESHKKFTLKRVENLQKEVVKRKGKIVDCLSEKQPITETEYYESMTQAIQDLHETNHEVDPVTGKKVSFGVIRVATIQNCVNLTKFLMEAEFPCSFAVRVMAYHSRQVLLLRHLQEKYLDTILNRKKEANIFNDPVIRKHIDKSEGEDISFFLIATPVEEVGRDHDFDWALVEPSSYRSVIQLAGRVRRHRSAPEELFSTNMGIMQCNLKAAKEGSVSNGSVYINPGYELLREPLESHDLHDLLDEAMIQRSIDAVPRIIKAVSLNYRKNFIDLEHYCMERFNDIDSVGPAKIHGWTDESWWMTAMPQKINPFRESFIQEISAFRVYERGCFKFAEYSSYTNSFEEVTVTLNIKLYELSNEQIERLWLRRDYKEALQEYLQYNSSDALDFLDEDGKLEKISKQFGEIQIPEESNPKWFYSDDLGLFKDEDE